MLKLKDRVIVKCVRKEQRKGEPKGNLNMYFKKAAITLDSNNPETLEFLDRKLHFGPLDFMHQAEPDEEIQTIIVERGSRQAVEVGKTYLCVHYERVAEPTSDELLEYIGISRASKPNSRPISESGSVFSSKTL